MDKLKVKARSARNRVAEGTSRGSNNAALAHPLSTLAPFDNASTTGVNEGFIGPQPGTSARDFALVMDGAGGQRAFEPPTSLQSSIDAGATVPQPRNGITRSQSRRRTRGISLPAPPLLRPSMGSRQSSIAIQRLNGPTTLRPVASNPTMTQVPLQQVSTQLSSVNEDGQLRLTKPATQPEDKQLDESRLKKFSSAIQSKLDFGPKKQKIGSDDGGGEQENSMQYTSDMVDVLDTVDPEVQTLTSLTNIQNSLFVPNLGRFINRRPTYNLQRPPSEWESSEETNRILASAQQEQPQGAPHLTRTQTAGTTTTLATIDSNMSDSRFAVLPHGASLEGWSKEDKKELNDHVRHMLHSRRSKFKRSMKGFGKYVRRPLGLFVTVYATLITLFGLAWVLFLIGWINVGGKQLYIIYIIDGIMVSLFNLVGIGLAPWRTVDTYHMMFIAHYHRLTWRRREKGMLPELRDHNDLPASNAPMNGVRTDSDKDPEQQWEFTVLTPQQQAKLEYHQNRFSTSHSFYKPHETETHYAFPLRLLISIVTLLDCHSALQIALCICTWAIDYKTRPFAITTVILCCSITCNATSGLLILIGDRRTRKKDVLERMNRQELTEEAMRHLEKKKEKEGESEREDSADLGKKEGRKSLHLLRSGRSGSKVDSAKD